MEEACSRMQGPARWKVGPRAEHGSGLSADCFGGSASCISCCSCKGRAARHAWKELWQLGVGEVGPWGGVASLGRMTDAQSHLPPSPFAGPSKHQSAVTCLQFSSKFVVTSSDDGTVKLWDLKTGEFVRNLVALESGGSGGVVWRIRASNTKLVCAVGSRNGTEETKLLVLDFDVDLK